MLADESPSKVQNIGVQVGDNAAIGGDFTGRDKLTTTTGDIHAADNSTVNVVTGSQTNIQLNINDARAGLELLDELLGTGERRQAVSAFRTDFQGVCDQINLLADYKALHDLLHQLQVDCHRPLMVAEARVSADETVWDELGDPLLALDTIRLQVATVVGYGRVPASRLSWIEDLDRVRADWQTALDQTAISPLGSASRRLKRLLARHPANMNACITEAARGLHLPNLSQALSQLIPVVTTAAEQPERLEKSVTTLTQLDSILGQRLNEHDHWQEVTDQLAPLEDDLSNSSALEWQEAWDDVKRKILALCRPETAWAVELTRHCAKLDSELSANNARPLRRSFGDVRRSAILHFYQVDLALRALCEELRLVAEPLAHILLKLE